MYVQLNFPQKFGSPSQNQVALGNWATGNFYPCLLKLEQMVLWYFPFILVLVRHAWQQNKFQASLHFEFPIFIFQKHFTLS